MATIRQTVRQLDTDTILRPKVTLRDDLGRPFDLSIYTGRFFMAFEDELAAPVALLDEEITIFGTSAVRYRKWQYLFIGGANEQFVVMNVPAPPYGETVVLPITRNPSYRYAHAAGAAIRVIWVEGPTTFVTDGTDGQVEYVWGTNEIPSPGNEWDETGEPGVYQCEWQFARSGRQFTVPLTSDDVFEIEVLESATVI